MGGFGTYRLALGHPDLFARALTLSGAVICGVRVAPGVDLPGTTTHCMRDGDTAPFVPNARWLPFVISRGAVDELVPIGGTTDQVSRFDAAGLRYRDVLWLAEDHIDQSARDSWFDAGPSMGQHRRTPNAGRLS